MISNFVALLMVAAPPSDADVRARIAIQVAIAKEMRSPLDDVKAPPFHGIGKHVMPPEAPVRPPVIRPAKKLPAGPLHSHRCPYDGTTWVHGDDSFGNPAAHRCPTCGRLVWQVHARNVARPIAAAPDPGGWVYPQSVTTGVCPPGHL